MFKHVFWGVIVVISIMFMNSKSIGQDVLDKASYQFFYEYNWQFDTLRNNDIRDDLIILQVGQNISKSFSYYAFRQDSLKATPDGEKVKRQLMNDYAREWVKNQTIPKGIIRGAMGTIVYKNHPLGKMTVTDAINLNNYLYTDEFHAQNWHVTDSTKIILNYTCQMAISDFRGRRWIAWFVSDIPISDGPWKFSGLPGLILEVYDLEKHYKFTIVGIEQVEDKPIVFSPVVLGYRSYGEYEITTRLEFLRALARYWGINAAVMNAELGKMTFDETPRNSRPHDFIERDYK